MSNKHSLVLIISINVSSKMDRSLVDICGSLFFRCNVTNRYGGNDHMMMEDRSYSTLSRHGLASSNSLLDGVPFKIGLNFKQPPKVIAGPELYRPSVSTALNVEYTFETEEAVLAWAQAREEALNQAALEQAEQLAEEQRKQTAEIAAHKEIEEDSNISGASQDGGNIYDVPRSTVSSPSNHVSQKPKPNVPPKHIGSKQMSEPGTILKPTPIQHTNIDNKLADTNSTFDVSMFESEADPFDNLELQTLNDMEELKILLDSSTKPSIDIISSQTITGHTQSSLGTNHSSDQPGDSATEIIYDMATYVKQNTWETFSDDTPEQSTSTETDYDMADNKVTTPSPTVDCPSADDTSEQVREDGDYVEITSTYKKQSVKFQNSFVSGVSNVSNSEDLTEKNSPSNILGGKLPSNLANSKLYKPVLPPFNKPGSSISDSNPNTNPFSSVSTQGSNPFLQQDSKNPFLNNAPDHQWGLINQTSDLDVGNSDLSQEHKDSSLTASNIPTTASKLSLLPPPPNAKLSTSKQSRMWSSVGPSLAASLDESSSSSSDRIPYNSYSRHSLSSSDLHSSSSFSDLGEVNSKTPGLQKPVTSQSSLQLWNRNRPLPPIPSHASATTHAPNPTSDSYKSSLLPPSQPVGLTDPYHSLSQEAQTFTDSLTSMGFLRARVARAVAKFGQDEKEVLDHLIAVDMLVEKKFAPVLAESALCSFKNDVDKAEQFLQMFTEFEELGFKSDKIHEALIATNMNYDKVLDILTS